jgi:hypothetical protein
MLVAYGNPLVCEKLAARSQVKKFPAIFTPERF